MPNEPPQQQTSFLESFRNSAYWMAFLAQTLAVSVEVILHRRMGSRAVGLRGFAAFLLIPMWMIFFPHDNVVPLMFFWLLFILGCARQRLSSVLGDLGHSRYTGVPSLQRFLPWCSEMFLKRTVEPVLVMVTGVLFLGLSQSLGSYLIVAGVGLGMSISLGEAVEKAKVRDLFDARAEQQSLMDRFRQEYGE